MYKKRFKLWGFVKNKESDVGSMMALSKRREDQGKMTRFLINGRPVNLKRVDTYLRRKKLNPAQLRAAAVASGLESRVARYLSCRTPSPPPSLLRSPDIYRRSEAIIAITRTYVTTKLDPSRLTVEEIEQVNISGGFIVFNEARSCEGMLTAKAFQPAGRMIRRLARQLEHEIKFQSWFVLSSIFKMVLELCPEWVEVATHMIRHAVAFARVYIRSVHDPLREALVSLDGCDRAVLIPTVISAVNCYRNRISELFGEHSLAAIESWSNYANAADLTTGHSSTIEKAERGRRQHAIQFGESDMRTIRYLYSLADLEWERARVLGSDLSMVLPRLQQLLECAEQAGDWPAVESAHAGFACVYRELGAYELAEQSMWAAIGTAIAAYADNDLRREVLPRLVHRYTILEDWLIRSGKHASAWDVRERREALLPPDEEEVAGVLGFGSEDTIG